MSLRSWWRNVAFTRRSRKAVQDIPKRRPLREFVYLDEVTLRSLLVSQTDTIPEQVSLAISQAEQAEITGKVAAGNDLVGKGEFGSRFQTNNSNTVQTSRKAIVQTLFNELRNDARLSYALVVSADPPPVIESVDQIAKNVDPSVLTPAASLCRGALIEVEVTLEVDPVFKLGTLVSEYTAMAEENPGMFGDAGRSLLREAEPVNRMLQRLLAGLIPIRAKAVNFSVISLDGVDYVARTDAVTGLGLPLRPLEVVGVTEHIGFWKDIRRVLFSSARVTMLCRVSRDGLNGSWTPVKLADLFREAVPGLVDQINEASRTGLNGLSLEKPADAQREAMTSALRLYQEKLEAAAGLQLEAGDNERLCALLASLPSGGPSASVQRRAFSLVREAVETKAGGAVLDPGADFAARQEARIAAGLELFPALARSGATSGVQGPPTPGIEPRLLDVEVVAIYW